jgi:hypothetical protein
VLGPAAAGLLLVLAGSAWCFVLNAVAFVPSIVVLLMLRLPDHRALQSSAGSVGPATGAWRFVADTPPVRQTLLLAVCAAACYNIAVVIPLVVADVFHADGGAFGLLAVGFGLGALPGAFLSATGPTTPRGTEVRMLAVLMGVAVLLSAGAPVFPLLFAALGFVGALVMWFIARANALVMLSTPTGIRGRVMGIWAMALPGSTVVTGVLVGMLAQLTDPRIAYAAVGVVTLAVAACSWRALRSSADVA